MEEDKFKDLLEDEELTALRLAALATKKKTEQNLNKTECAQHIDSIITTPASSESLSNQIPFVQSDRSVHNNSFWWKQNQPSRRRGGSFPKNQRSNLIVISPVTLNDAKDTGEKAPPLILPQHKWCNSGNEDSMSPKTLRRTGPTRFNRHGSDSESSDEESDYERSDNDSGSNETILQDEPPEHFSCLSPDNLSDSVEKKRRLSFQSLDSDVKSDAFDKNEATSVYKSLKNSLYSDSKQDKYVVQHHLNDREQIFNNSDENIYNNSNVMHPYATKSSDLSDDLVFKHNKSSIGKGESGTDNINSSLNKSCDPPKIWQDVNINNSICYSRESENSRKFRFSDGNHKDYADKRQSIQRFTDAHSSKNSIWQHSESFRNDDSIYHVENQGISADPRSYSDNNAKSHYLSDNDLRLELKKRMQEMKSKTTSTENNEMNKNKTYTQYDNLWDKNRSEYSQKGSEIHLSSANSIGATQESSFHQASRIKQNFTRENDDERVSRFNQQRSRRSISKERTMQENFSSRDKNRFDYSFDERRRYSRSSSLDRNRNARSSSQGRRRNERSSSRDEKRSERSSSQSRIKRNNDDGRSESNLNPHRNKFESSYRHSKNDSGNNFAEGRRNWYKSSPKERSERSSSRDRSKRGCSSSSESRRGRSTSRERNKFSNSNSRRNQQYNAASNKERHTQSHDRNLYENNESRSRNRFAPNSTYNRKRREHSSSHDRSRHDSSQSPDSRSERSCSPKKHRYSSSQEGSKGERSSSESENRYRSHSKGTFNASKFTSEQDNSKYNIMNQNTNIKARESNQDLMQECNNLQSKKIKSDLNFGTMKDEGLGNINITSQSKSVERSRSQRSKSKEKIFSLTKTNKRSTRMKNSYKKRYSRSHSSSSESSSSSYSSSSNDSGKPKIRSVPSVIKSVLMKCNNESKGNVCENKLVGKSTISVSPQTSVHSICTKKNLDNAEINKPSIKCGRTDSDSKASEGKRVPVHMRLGAFPRKRVIQMPKDVEAAFVNSSSSSDGENINIKCKKQNIRIVTDLYNAKDRIDLIHQKYSSDNKSAKRSSPDTNEENFKRMKAQR